MRLVWTGDWGEEITLLRDLRMPVNVCVSKGLLSALSPPLRPVATVIVRHGTLRCGDVLAAGNTWGKVRAMLNDQKRPLQCATPSMPVLTVGWRDVPIAGEECLQVRG